MLFAHALVHHHLKAGFSGPAGGGLIDHALLHPHHLGLDADGLVHDRRDVLRPSEDVHHIHLIRDGGEVRIAGLTEYIGESRVDRYDPVSLFLQIGEHPVAGALGIGRGSDHGHSVAVSEYLLFLAHFIHSSVSFGGDFNPLGPPFLGEALKELGDTPKPSAGDSPAPLLLFIVP